jgi:hypothetical protein
VLLARTLTEARTTAPLEEERLSVVAFRDYLLGGGVTIGNGNGVAFICLSMLIISSLLRLLPPQPPRHNTNTAASAMNATSAKLRCARLL